MSISILSLKPKFEEKDVLPVLNDLKFFFVKFLAWRLFSGLKSKNPKKFYSGLILVSLKSNRLYLNI
jgi:hypothetical protein